jgi:hypothetical protein
MFEWGIVLGALGLFAAGMFEWGRAHMRKEIVAYWRLGTCRDCGNHPLPTMIHKSGCGSGWEPVVQIPLDKLP